MKQRPGVVHLQFSNGFSSFRGRTGVTVVSSQPQSTTRPVMRPLAANANRLVGVNDTEGTFHQLTFNDVPVLNIP
jgi:hypothetical protein